jgi:phosphoenolpyruvate carboxylase
MNPSDNSSLQLFDKEVGLKFQLFNSLFTALPFHKVEKTGVLVSIFLLHCEEGYESGKSPVQIISSFLKQYTTYDSGQDEADLLFRFVQYSERQVVLFDALEDAAFPKVTDLGGSGTLNHLLSEVSQHQMQEEIRKKFTDFSIRLVLTAHPTQFYPNEVLVIISDLAKAITDEYLLTKRYLLKLTAQNELMERKPVNQLSISMRQRIELPLLTIQQYALHKIRELEESGGNSKMKNVYGKLAMRCSFGIINAERNSA